MCPVAAQFARYGPLPLGRNARVSFPRPPMESQKTQPASDDCQVNDRVVIPYSPFQAGAPPKAPLANVVPILNLGHPGPSRDCLQSRMSS